MFGIKNKTVQESFLRVGVDIGSKSLKIAEIRENGKELVIENFQIIDIPEEKDHGKKIALIAKLLRNAFSPLAGEKYEVYSLLTGQSEVIINRVLLPKMKDRDLLEAIKWEVKSLLPFPLENAVIDYFILKDVPKEKGKLDLLVVAMKKETIDATTAAFEAAGIKLSGLTIAPFAAWELLKKAEILKKDKTIALVNIGSENTRISFFNGENLEYYREFSIAGDSFTKAMIGLFVSDTWQMNLDYAQAEETKIKYGIPDDNTTEKTTEGIPLIQILQILKPVLRRFLNEAVRSFSYYKEQFSKEILDTVIISGGTSRLKNLKSNLSTGLDSKVEDLGSLLKVKPGKDIKDASLLETEIPNISSAIGAALAGPIGMNVLKKTAMSSAIEMPPFIQKFVTSVIQSEQFKSASTVIAASGIALIIIVGGLATFITNHNINYYKKSLSEKQSLLSNLKILSEKRLVLTKIESQKAPVREAVAELTNIMPENTFLNILSFDGGSRTFYVEGTSKNMNSVGSLIKQIEASSFFGNTMLIEARRDSASKDITFKAGFKLSI